MERIVLPRGLRIIGLRKPTDSVTLQVTISVGSDFEDKNNNGISHFIEHMLFEGTPSRKDARAITNEIESLGGEINAFTSNERTCYYIKVPKEHFAKALGILADIVQHPLFQPGFLEKERKVILREISLYHDEPRSFQWVLFQRALFGNHPAGFPTYGTNASVAGLSRAQLFQFYQAQYAANQAIIACVGDYPQGALASIEGSFRELGKRKASTKIVGAPHGGNRDRIVEKRPINHAYLVYGCKTPDRLHPDSYVLDVIRSILGRGQSGMIFEEIRNKRGLAYDVGVHHEAGRAYGFFAAYLNTLRKNVPLALKLIRQEFEKLKDTNGKDLEEAKGYITGQLTLDHEDTHRLADALGFWEHVNDARLEEEYLKKINGVSAADVRRAAKQYLSGGLTLAMLEPK
ncbi:insulinase family protein [Candidatus Woesearchaeota archaeon]|nr:insulinase family protein [Candidatus Woesearchaeota archaeon]